VACIALALCSVVPFVTSVLAAAGGATIRGQPLTVDCVEEVDTHIKGAVHGGEAVGFARQRAKAHRSQTQTTDLQATAAQSDVVR
jgi:hypothetical protein